MRFGLDGVPLRGKKSGIGHYTLELARALAALAPEHEFEIVSPDAFSSPLSSAPNLHFTDTRARGLQRRYWWPIGLPLYCRRASFALFHGTNFDLPYWSSCPRVLTIHDLSLLLFPQTHEEHLVRRARRVLPLKLTEKSLLAADVMRLTLQPPRGEMLNRLPGQYLDVLLPQAKRRAFSIANAPHTGTTIELHVRHVAGLLVDHQGERAGQNHLNARTRQFGFPP